MAGPKPLRIGVFVPKSVQLLDLSPVDLFAMLDPFYLEACRLPAPLVAMGIASTIHYIAASSLQSHVELTANAILKVTKTVLDEEVQPGMLDIILVPGASPSDLFEEEVYEFVRGHVAWKGLDGKQVDVLSVCTGCFVLAYAGVLKGKKSSGPRALVPTLQKKFPETKWVDDRRWVIDGNIWSSGGVTNGQEMVAAYMREKFPGPTTEAVLAIADVGEKGIEYTTSTTQDSLWWGWQILKSVLLGLGRKKKVL